MAENNWTAREAIDHALGLMNADQVTLPEVGLLMASGALYFTSGTYDISGSIELPPHCGIDGEGMTSVLQFTDGGIKFPGLPDSNYGNDASVNAVSICNVSEQANPTLYGIEIQGGARYRVTNCWIIGFQIGIILDQGELTIIENVMFGNSCNWCPPEENIGVLFKAPPRPPATIGGATNANWIRYCQFNGPATPIRHEGDVANVIQCCTFVSSGPCYVNGNMCSFRDCSWEDTIGEAAIIAEHPDEVPSIQLEVSRCHMNGDHSFLWFRGKTSYALWFCGNMGQTAASPLLRIDALLVGPVICLGNTNHGTGLVVGGDHPNVFGSEAAIYVSSAYLAGEAPDPGYWARVGTGIGTLQPQGPLDVQGTVVTIP
ncbi:hypothetical protein ACQPYH_28395 [Kribbella sp. CA-245084]|uniref:hypothetical protein n=1 Tax=Kribbella sp. CA-245084 TaxID=3239940 RepID=UPI003D8E94E7